MSENFALFAEHVNEIVEKHPNEWKFIDEKIKHKGIFMVSKWRDAIVRTTRVLFNADYPEKPPIVKVTPRPKDPCFDSEGFLHWAEHSRNLVWSRYKHHLNPLIYLIDELYDKYGVDLFFDLKI
ncbi:MAG: hypothetical protein ACTSRW_15180 [Candidatus Helarchaeota archaeon]